MNCFVLPYGRPGWEEKNRIIAGLVSSRSAPPFDYSDILVLVPSVRMKRSRAKSFLNVVERQFGTHAMVQPVIRTFHEFLQESHARLGGTVLIDEHSRLVLIEGIIKRLITSAPTFGISADVLAPSLSAAAAETIDELSHAGVTPERLRHAAGLSGFSDKPQLRLIIDAYGEYRRILAEKNLQDPGGLFAELTERFDPSWTSRYTAILIDGMPEGRTIPGRLLSRIASHPGCTLLVEAPSPEAVSRAHDDHPLRLTREFIAAAGGTPGRARPQAVPVTEGDRFLGAALFSDTSFADAAAEACDPSACGKQVDLLSTVNKREELSLIAREVKHALRSGTPADNILVTFPGLDEYGPLVEELFTDFGIPYNRALGRQLSTSPVTTALVSLLQASQDDYTTASLVRIFSSPFLKFAAHPRLATALDRLSRRERIPGGRNRVLAAVSRPDREDRDAELLRTALVDLFGALDRFSSSGSLPLAEWMNRFEALIEWSDIAGRVEQIKGPLNSNLQAFLRLRATSASLAHAGNLFPEYTYTFHEWFFLLRKTFMHVRFQVPPDDESGVQVLGLEESNVQPWSLVFFGGLTDTAFPRRLPQNIFLPRPVLDTLGVRTLESARLAAAQHFYRLLLSAPRIMLTYPESDADRAMIPSPFLEELAPLRIAGLLNRGRQQTQGVQYSLKIEDSGSVPELAKAISLADEKTDLSALITSGIVGTAGIRSALAAAPAASPSVLPEKRTSFSVTELQEYLDCPYAYYAGHVLGLAPLEEPSEDMTRLDLGSIVHRILYAFYHQAFGMRPVTPETRDEAKNVLRKLARESFLRRADTFRNRRERDLFLTVIAERFLDAETEFWNTGMKPCCLEQTIEQFPLQLHGGAIVELTAKIDRIDVDANGDFIVVDYKTGKYPTPKMGAVQDIFQLPLYAVMAQQSPALPGAALRRPVGLAYYDLSGRMGGPCRDIVLFNRELRSDLPTSKPKASPKTAEEFSQILNQSIEKARTAVAGILANNFPAGPSNGTKCRNCPHDELCDKEEDEGDDE